MKILKNNNNEKKKGDEWQCKNSLIITSKKK